MKYNPPAIVVRFNDGLQANRARQADKLFHDPGLETFRRSHYYFYLTVIKNQAHKKLKAQALSRARQARSPWLAPYVLTLVAGITLLTATSSASLIGESLAPPELVIDSTRRDFGEVFVGEELDQVFTVRNVGTTPLELSNKTLTARSSASLPGWLTGASSSPRLDAVTNYLKPVAAIKRLAAPT